MVGVAGAMRPRQGVGQPEVQGDIDAEVPTAMQAAEADGRQQVLGGTALILHHCHLRPSHPIPLPLQPKASIGRPGEVQLLCSLILRLRALKLA